AADATAISYMYQRGLDMVAATILAAAVAEAFRPDATVESVCRAALAVAPTEPLRTFDKRPFESCRHYLEACLAVAERHSDVLAVRKELYARCLLYHMIDPLEVLGFSLAMFKVAQGDVRQAAIGGTNIGRDSDTIAGRAAMLSGILRGAGNVPPDWVSLFSADSLARIDRNADRLAHLVASRKLDVLKRRQSIAAAQV
ncbi:MAG: ADP-ribosylglycohydrolase family protein, partial [Planctomycetes bacterium]|nr:ADP-ribosylglycohydrolase family protein [Planctomycetota bacterium]